MNNNNSSIFGNNLNINNIQTNFSGLDSKYKIIIFAVFLVFLVFIGFIAYIYWTNYKTNKVQSFQEETLLEGMYDCNNRKSPMKIEPSKIPTSTMGSEYSLNIWIYVTEAQNRDGYVLKRGPAAGNIKTQCNPGIILKQDTNDMVIYFEKQTGNTDSVDTFTGDYTIEQFHSDEGRLVEGLENLEHFYGLNDELENNYIIEGFFTIDFGELNKIFKVIKDNVLQNEFQFTIPEEELVDDSSSLSNLQKNPLLEYIESIKIQQYETILDRIKVILDSAANKNLKLSDKEIKDIYDAVQTAGSGNGATWTADPSSVINTGLDTVSDGIKTSLSNLLGSSIYIQTIYTMISVNDTNFNRILDGAKQIHHKKDDDDDDGSGTVMDGKRKEYMKKELIKLYINDINNINLEDEEITKMVELILNITTDGTAVLPDNDSTGNRKTAIDNIYAIVTGIRKLIDIMLGNDTSLVLDEDKQLDYYNKYPNLKLEVPTRNIIVTQILDNVFTQYDITYDTGAGVTKKKSDIEKLLKNKLDILNSGGSLSDSGVGGVVESTSLESEDNYITIHNIPLQRWTCLNISVFNQTVDIYVDGKLKNSKTFRFNLKPPGPLPMTLGPLHEDGMSTGFNGYLSRIKYSNRALNPGQVRQRYEEGPRITKGLWESITSFFSSEEEVEEE